MNISCQIRELELEETSMWETPRMRVLDLTVLVNRAALSVMIHTRWFIRFYFIFVGKTKIPSAKMQVLI